MIFTFYCVLLFFFFLRSVYGCLFFFFFQAEDGIRDPLVTGVQTCALPILDTADLQRLGHRVRAGRQDLLRRLVLVGRRDRGGLDGSWRPALSAREAIRRIARANRRGPCSRTRQLARVPQAKRAPCQRRSSTTTATA